MGEKNENGLIDFDLDQLAKRSTLIRKKEAEPIQEQITIERIFENLASRCPEIVTRKKLQELTGGLVSEKYLANLDSLGSGIQPRLRIGGKICYPKKSALSWLMNRADFF